MSRIVAAFRPKPQPLFRRLPRTFSLQQARCLQQQAGLGRTWVVVGVVALPSCASTSFSRRMARSKFMLYLTHLVWPVNMGVCGPKARLKLAAGQQVHPHHLYP